MEPRLLIAYLLIGALLAAGVALFRHVRRKREEERRIMRGHRSYKGRRTVSHR